MGTMVFLSSNVVIIIIIVVIGISGLKEISHPGIKLVPRSFDISWWMDILKQQFRSSTKINVN